MIVLPSTVALRSEDEVWTSGVSAWISTDFRHLRRGRASGRRGSSGRRRRGRWRGVTFLKPAHLGRDVVGPGREAYGAVYSPWAFVSTFRVSPVPVLTRTHRGSLHDRARRVLHQAEDRAAHCLGVQGLTATGTSRPARHGQDEPQEPGGRSESLHIGVLHAQLREKVLPAHARAPAARRAWWWLSPLTRPPDLPARFRLGLRSDESGATLSQQRPIVKIFSYMISTPFMTESDGTLQLYLN